MSVLLPAVLPALFVSVLSPASAQVVPATPFSGELSEGFESYPQTGAPLPCLSDAFGNNGEVCAPDAAVGGIQVRDSLFLGCLLDPFGGNRLAGSNDSYAEIRFDAPVQRFGGRFATHADDGDLTLEAYDIGGTLIGSLTNAFGGSCNWQWHGLESTGPGISYVRVFHSEHGGALADFDDLHADTVCGLGAPDADADGVPACLDCNDADPTVFPGAPDGCDGVDNDCNGIPDDRPPGAGLASLQNGVCAGATQVCGSNGLVDPDYTLIPGYEAAELSCDGVDNDCNGILDDIADPPAFDDQGVCVDILLECDAPNGFVEPADLGAFELVEESCDGLDNDCDGQVDNGLVAPPSGAARGVCSEMVQVCAGSAGWQEPEDLPPEFGREICNGLDDDCDGVVDDDCVNESIFTQCGCAASGSPVWAGLFAPLLLLVRRRG